MAIFNELTIINAEEFKLKTKNVIFITTIFTKLAN